MSSAFLRRRSVALLATAGLCLAGVQLTGAYASAPPAAADDLTITPTGPEAFTEEVNGFADVQDTQATHVRLVALENQCSGQAQFAGDQDQDPLNETDCKTASDRDESARAAELEVFSS